ncbi:hypothetical protein [Allobaculum sp. JKK-2023]|uniref:hypothetical protein n=1 Tax=Allobaculum sp. JKK-2023 TaxID=3108943 RepID=UPI002B052397|nr:hypothetical protein [Allobaculum sp. JKK-2023]
MKKTIRKISLIQALICLVIFIVLLYLQGSFYYPQQVAWLAPNILIWLICQYFYCIRLLWMMLKKRHTFLIQITVFAIVGLICFGIGWIDPFSTSLLARDHEWCIVRVVFSEIYGLILWICNCFIAKCLRSKS